jgi:hypothetical protein
MGPHRCEYSLTASKSFNAKLLLKRADINGYAVGPTRRLKVRKR